MIGIEQQLFQTSRVPQYLLGDAGQRAVAFVNKLHLSIAALEDRNALEHCGDRDDVEGVGNGGGGRTTLSLLILLPFSWVRSFRVT